MENVFRSATIDDHVEAGLELRRHFLPIEVVNESRALVVGRIQAAYRIKTQSTKERIIGDWTVLGDVNAKIQSVLEAARLLADLMARCNNLLASEGQQMT